MRAKSGGETRLSLERAHVLLDAELVAGLGLDRGALLGLVLVDLLVEDGALVVLALVVLRLREGGRDREAVGNPRGRRRPRARCAAKRWRDMRAGAWTARLLDFGVHLGARGCVFGQHRPLGLGADVHLRENEACELR